MTSVGVVWPGVIGRAVCGAVDGGVDGLALARAGRLSSLSAIAMLRDLNATRRVGT